MTLKQWLAENQITHLQFAKMIGKTGGYVSQIKNGKTFPSKDVFLRIRKITKGACLPNDFLDL